MKLDVVIRVGPRSECLGLVLESVRAQRGSDYNIVAVDCGASREALELLQQFDARVVVWGQPYCAPKVLNWAFEQCHEQAVFVLSSHTILLSKDTFARSTRELNCSKNKVFGVCHTHYAYGAGIIDKSKLEDFGLFPGSILSNSSCLIGRDSWLRRRFNERLLGSEDYEWALGHIMRGGAVASIPFDYDYRRSGGSRRQLRRWQTLMCLAKIHGLKLNAPSFFRALFGGLSGIAAYHVSGRELGFEIRGKYNCLMLSLAYLSYRRLLPRFGTK